MNSHTSPRAAWARWFFLLAAASYLAATSLPAGRLRAESDPDIALTVSFAQRPTGKVAVLAWQGAPGASYKVQYRTTLSEPVAWVDFEVVVAQAPVTTSEVPLALLGSSAPDEGFFRLVLPQPGILLIEPALLGTDGGDLYVGGQCFAPGDMVRIGGTDYAATFFGHTLLRAQLPAGFTPGTYLLSIVRGGDVIASLDHALTIVNGLALETLEPPSLPPGTPLAIMGGRHGIDGEDTTMTCLECVEIAHEGLKCRANYLGDSRPAFGFWTLPSGELAGTRVDLAVRGRGLDFIWATSYRSRNGEATTMGNNWAHSYDIRCALNGIDMDVWDGTGRRVLYSKVADGSFGTRVEFRRGTFTAGNVFTLEFADKGRWVFRPLDGSPAAGKIAQSIDRNGNALQFSYNAAGRLAQIIDTLGRPYHVQYNAAGRVSAVSDFTGRMVLYGYCGPGDPNGPEGALRSIRSPVVAGTPTGNDFLAGKTTIFTYSTGQPDPRLNNNLLTVTDPKGQTAQRFAYAPSVDPLDPNFDRVVSVQLGNPAEPIDRPMMLSWLAQTPSPANGFAVLKMIANDPVGNVTTHLFDSRNLLVAHVAHTGRSAPGVPVTETTNLPAGQLRPGDPSQFTTTIDWNLHYRPERITRPGGQVRTFSWESDFNPDANPRVLGNLRTMVDFGTAPGTYASALRWRIAHEPGFGTAEHGTLVFEDLWPCIGDRDFNDAVAFRPVRITPKPAVARAQSAAVVGPAGEEIFTDTYSRVKVQFHWDRKGKHDADTTCRSFISRLMEEEGIYYSFWPRIGQEVVVGYTKVELEDCIISGFQTATQHPGRLYTDANFIRFDIANQNVDPTIDDVARGFAFAFGGASFGLDDFRYSIAGTRRDPTPAFCFSQGPGEGGMWDPPTGEPPIFARVVLENTLVSSWSSITDPRGQVTTASYDAAGNRTQVQSPLASTVDDFTYNAFGQLASHTHPANGSGHRRLDTFTYFNAGVMNGYLNRMKIDDGGFALTTGFEYDARGNVVRVIDPRGNDTLLTRNALNQVVRVQLPAVQTPGGPVRYERDFIYDANDCLVRLDVQNVDENGALGTPAHFSTSWTYDFRNCARDRTETVDNNETITIGFRYDGNRNLTQLTLPEAMNGNDPNNVVRFEHDERDLPFRSTRAPGTAVQSTTQYDYGLNGRLTAHRQGLESAPRVTLFGYDGFDRFVRSTDAAGNVRDVTLDGLGSITRLTVTGNAQIGGPPVLLSVADYDYNELSRLQYSRLAFFDPVGGLPLGDGARTTTLARAPNQQVTSITGDNGHTTSFLRDTANRLARVIDARGNRRDFTLDANGNTTAMLWTDKRDSGAPDEQFRRTFDYDALNRLERAQDNIANLATYRYDSRGNLTRRTDPRGTDTLYQYDGLSRRIRSVEDMDASGSETPADITRVFTYDDNSRLTRVTDDNGNITSHSYDALNRPVGTLRADGTVIGETYDEHYNRISSLDANGTAITYTYDLLNRLTQKAITPGPSVAATTTFEQFFYDGMSRVLRAVNDAATVDFTYDSLSNRRSETTGGLTTSATFDALGNRLALAYPSGRVLTYGYDVLDRVAIIQEMGGPPGSFLATYSYAGADRIERAVFGNGTQLDVTYDGQLGGPVIPGDFGWRKPVLVAHTKTGGGAVIDDRAMTWDRNQSKITRRQLTPFTPGGAMQSRAFTYDADDRLVQSLLSAGGPAMATQYQLDGEDNRVQVIGGLNPGAYTRDPTTPAPADFQMNQYTTTPSDTRQYDENGNTRLTNPTGPNSMFRFLTFDYANRLVAAQLAGGLTVQNTYDVLGRRTRRDVQPPGPPIAITTRFLHDGEREIEERDGSGAVLALYVPASVWAAEDVVTSSDADQNDVVLRYCSIPLQMRRGGQDYWPHADDTGSVLALTDANGAVAERYDYDDYGTARFLDPTGAPMPGAPQSAAGNPYLFHSLRWEPEVRLFNLGGAFWDHQIGRWMNEADAAARAAVEAAAELSLFIDDTAPPGEYSAEFTFTATAN